MWLHLVFLLFSGNPNEAVFNTYLPKRYVFIIHNVAKMNKYEFKNLTLSQNSPRQQGPIYSFTATYFCRSLVRYPSGVAV